LLQLLIALKSSFFEKVAYVIVSLLEISFNRQILTWQSWAELNDLWRASYKLSSLIYSWLLKYIALVARRFFFLTQFMSSQELHFLLVILLIFLLKNFYFIFLTVFLNLFQSSSCQVCLYMSKSLQQILSHYTLEYLYYISSILAVNDWMILTVIEAWLDVSLHSRWIWWLLYSIELGHKTQDLIPNLNPGYCQNI